MKVFMLKGERLSPLQERLNMKRFNLSLEVRKVLKGMLAVFAGITIPACVFQITEKFYHAALNNVIIPPPTAYTYLEYISDVTAFSTMFAYTIGKYYLLFLAVITSVKFALGKQGANEDSKTVGRKLCEYAAGVFMIRVMTLLPVVLPRIIEYANVCILGPQ